MYTELRLGGDQLKLQFQAKGKKKKLRNRS